jgi:hypothetical protein
MHKLAIVFALIVSTNVHAAITGTVVDADAKPIAGATIRAYTAEDSSAMRARIIAGKLDREPVATVQSAENGSFSIELKSPAAVDVVIEAPAHSRATIPTVDGDDLGAITLGPPPTRMLKVTSGGKPVANAIVISGLEVARTNAEGEVPATLNGAALVAHPDYAPASREPANAPSVRLTRGVAVRGRVVKGSEPVAHAIVSINGWPLAESGDDGTFTIAHAPDNWRSISAVRGNEAGTVTRSKAASVEIRLGTGASFAGTLRDAKRGAAVASARMTLTGAGVSMIVLSDAKGGFTFAPLLPDDYQLSGLHSAYAIESAAVQVPATRSRAVAAQPFARARGHVLNEEKKPVASAFVSSSGTGGARGRSAVTNAAGEFSVRVVPTLTYPIPLYASKREFVTGASESRIWQPGETRDDMVITLAHGFVAKVQVVDKKENPVPNAQVNVTRAGEGPQRTTAVACADPSLPDCHRTGVDGIVSLRTIEGRHDFIVFGDDVSPVRLPNQVLNARSATIVVHVDRGVEISGRVVLADGTPVAGANVELPTQIMPRSAVSAADGTFTIAGVASGSSVVTAVSSDGHLSSTPVTVNAPAKDVTLTMPRGGRIEGRVLDRGTQQPLTDFTILRPSRSGRGDWNDSGQQPIHSDDGRYALDNVSPGVMRLLVRASGYVAGSRTDIAVEDGKTVSGIDIQLDRGAKISGRVTSANAPVAGVQVRLAFQRMPSFNEAATDADGLYSLDGIAEGDRTIEFQKTGFVVAHKPVEITAGKDVRIDVELDRGRELRGRVTDHSGRGLSGVYIAASVAEQRSSWNPVMTDADGTFLMQGLAEGKYKVTARKDGLVSGEASDVDVPQNRPLNLTMEAGATISGRVSGVPPEQFTQVILTASGGSSRNQTNADASGNFSLPGLPDGRVRVDAFLNAGVRRRMAPFKTITVENGTAPFVEMNFDDGITLNGHVTRAGVIQPGGNINFIPKTAKGSAPSPDRQSASASISADGSYTASGLTAGDYDVRINAPGLAYSTAYTAIASGVYDIDIRGALLRGRVVDATSNAPLPETRVSVSSRAPAFGSATTDSDGRFAISALVDATYTMQVSRDQYAASTQEIVVSNGSVPDVDVRLEQAPAVTVHIVDATTGAPIDGNVFITDATPAHTFSGQAMRVDAGTFKVWLKPGNYKAGANARGYIYNVTSFTTPPTEVTVALVRGGTLVIRARTAAQQVRLELPTGALKRPLGPIHEGTNGPYEAIPPGSYLLSTYGTDRTVIRSMPVTIMAGETVTIDLP